MESCGASAAGRIKRSFGRAARRELPNQPDEGRISVGFALHFKHAPFYPDIYGLKPALHNGQVAFIKTY